MNDSARANHWALLLIASITALRFWMSGAIELIGDEAYYWLWSKHLAAGYYSKPPGVAWAIALGTSLLGDTERGVRLPAILCSFFTAWGLYRLGREVAGPGAGFVALLIALVTPLFWAGSLLMTIDSLAVCAWVWAANFLWMIHRRASFPKWIGLGIAIGLGLLAKPTLLAFYASIALWMLAWPTDRRWIRDPGFWIAILVSLSALIPPLWWNAQNDWITFAHLKERGALDKGWSISIGSFLSFLGGQAGVAGPWLFFLFLMALARRSMRCAVAPDARAFFTALWAPLFVFYAILALNDPGQPNWPAPAWIGAILYTASAWAPRLVERPVEKRIAAAAFGVLLALGIALHVALLFWHVPAQGNRDPFERARGHRDLGAQIALLKKEKNAAFVIGSHYQTAALLTWYSPERERAYTIARHPPRNQFDLWPSYRDAHPLGSDALYVARGRHVPDDLRREFEAIEELGAYRGRFRGKPEREYWVYMCRTLQPRAEP